MVGANACTDLETGTIHQPLLMLTLFITLGLCLALFIGLTHPLELRRGRWVKIGVSLIVVFLLTTVVQQGLNQIQVFFVFVFVALCSLWKGNLAYFITQGVMIFLYGEWSTRATGGFRPDYRAIRSRMEEGDLDEAIEQTKKELEKAPKDYEGLMLLATLYHEQQLPDEALVHLEVILHNPRATDEQKRNATLAKTQCYQLKHYLSITRRR